MIRPRRPLPPVSLPALSLPASVQVARPGWREALAGLAGAGMLANALVGTPTRGALVLGLTGGLALLTALLLGQRWCGTIAAAAALVGVGVLAGMRPASASTGRIAAEALLLIAYLVLADAAESRAPPAVVVRAVPTVLASMAVALLVLAALELPPAPYAWLAVLGLVAALTAFGLVARTGMGPSAGDDPGGGG